MIPVGSKRNLEVLDSSMIRVAELVPMRAMSLLAAPNPSW